MTRLPFFRRRPWRRPGHHPPSTIFLPNPLSVRITPTPQIHSVAQTNKQKRKSRLNESWQLAPTLVTLVTRHACASLSRLFWLHLARLRAINLLHDWCNTVGTRSRRRGAAASPTPRPPPPPKAVVVATGSYCPREIGDSQTQARSHRPLSPSSFSWRSLESHLITVHISRGRKVGRGGDWERFTWVLLGRGEVRGLPSSLLSKNVPSHPQEFAWARLALLAALHPRAPIFRYLSLPLMCACVCPQMHPQRRWSRTVTAALWLSMAIATANWHAAVASAVLPPLPPLGSVVTLQAQPVVGSDLFVRQCSLQMTAAPFSVDDSVLRLVAAAQTGLDASSVSFQSVKSPTQYVSLAPPPPPSPLQPLSPPLACPP
jgi:hypothetical protein